MTMSDRQAIRDKVRADALDRQAQAFGYPSSTELGGIRPGYVMRLRAMAIRVGDAGAQLAIDRLEEVSRDIAEAREEQHRLMDLLLEFERTIAFVDRVRS